MNNSNDIINQITLNCLISKEQLSRINNLKIKKNIDAERKEKIKENYKELKQLFSRLIDDDLPEYLFDDVKSSYVHFIDKSLIYINFLKERDLSNELEKTNTEIKDEINENLDVMLEKCLEVNIANAIDNLLNKKEESEGEEDEDFNDGFEDDENDGFEDDENDDDDCDYVGYVNKKNKNTYV